MLKGEVIIYYYHSSFTLNLSLGLDNIGLSGSIKNGDTTNSFGVTADLSQLKVGFEGATTIKWDENKDVTDYTNVSVTAMGVVAICMLATTGQPILAPA